ncbi:spermidine/putrescine ABC transporter substrate-binding protein [Candidatus Mycoplasma haematohominis]|uniref:spermidine/putrescine ABC transporter substrate-binding protein n=1 Tax=Candidatus Mycoplasma haematohominis TaxID=1494318 RepID=UPI0034E233FB
MCIHDQVVHDRFSKGIYDMSVVSTSILEELMESDLVNEIDWKKLELLTRHTHNGDYKNAKDYEKIDNGWEAISLFSGIVRAILQSNPNLIRYGIPYFMNKLSFCYRGTEIDGLKGKVTWKTLVEEISKDSRFYSKNGKSKLGLMDDPRTVLSLSRFVAGEKSVNPAPGLYRDHSSIYDTYTELLKYLNKNKMGSNFLFLSPYSSALVDSLAYGDIKGAIMYNADCLYTSYGGNLGLNYVPHDLHLVDIETDIYFLDFIVISNKLSETKIEKVYEFYKKMLMNGHNKGRKILSTNKQDSYDETSEEYLYEPTQNFDYVRYTPVLRNLHTHAARRYFNDDSEMGSITDSKKQEEMKQLRRRAMATPWVQSTSKDIKNLYESSFSSKTKSDMLIAFEKFKAHL